MLTNVKHRMLAVMVHYAPTWSEENSVPAHQATMGMLIRLDVSTPMNAQDRHAEETPYARTWTEVSSATVRPDSSGIPRSSVQV